MKEGTGLKDNKKRIARRSLVAGAGLGLVTVLTAGSVAHAGTESRKITTDDASLYETQDLDALAKHLNLPQYISSDEYPLPNEKSISDTTRDSAFSFVSMAEVEKMKITLGGKADDVISFDGSLGPVSNVDGGQAMLSGMSTQSKVAWLRDIAPYTSKYEMKYGFIGKLKESFPVVAATSRMIGKGSLQYSLSKETSHSVATTTEWSVGGSLNAAAVPAPATGGALPGAGLDSNFSYSHSTTVTDTTGTIDTTILNLIIPDKVSGWLEARFNGGVYEGWFLWKNSEKWSDWAGTGAPDRPGQWVAIPVTVNYKSADASVTSDMTWIQRGEIMPVR